MDAAAAENDLRKLRILVAPLDWGLGHATRCIPVIYELLKHSCEVWIAAEGAQEVLLKEEFPQLNFLPLRGYRIRYGRSAAATTMGLLWQIGKITRAIERENDWLRSTVDEYGFDAVITDNRYGLFHEKIPCIFITHQLLIKTPFGKWSEKLLQKRNYHFIHRFTECWIPDIKKNNGLAGDMSHPAKMPAIPTRYIGSLSRFAKHKKETGIEEEKAKLLFILSGPEPQRSILEDKIIREIAHYDGTAVIVRGLPASARLVPSSNSIRFYNHLPADDLFKEMLCAEYIISRSGYSSVMDIFCLQKKSILIPTPGQTEQQYLAQYLSSKKAAVCIDQKDFSIKKALEAAAAFDYRFPETNDNTILADVIDRFVGSLR